MTHLTASFHCSYEREEQLLTLKVPDMPTAHWGDNAG